MDGSRVRPSRAVTSQNADQLEGTTRTDQLGLSEKRNGVPLVGNSRTREVSFGYKALFGADSPPASHFSIPGPASPARECNPQTPAASRVPLPISHHAALPPFTPNEPPAAAPRLLGVPRSQHPPQTEPKLSSTASPLIQVISRRSQSPTFNSKSNVQELNLLRRSQSAERRRPSSNPLSACSRPLTPSPKFSRPSTPANDSVTEKHSTTRNLLVGKTHDGLWPSVKSYSLSFGMSSSKNAILERKWNPLSRKSFDLSENAMPVEELHKRTVERSRRLGLSRKLSANTSKSNCLITPASEVLHGRFYDHHVSDKGHKQLRSVVERRATLDCNRHSKNESCLSMSSPHLCSSEKALPAIKESRKSSLPITRSHHPCPTLKAFSSTLSASNSEKSRVRSTKSVLNYSVQVRKRKQSTKRMEDAHELRMVYNGYLQWRFVNALAEDVLSVQRKRAETTLYNMENVSSELNDPFIQKRIYMQQMKQDMMLNKRLKEQITHLEDWGTNENEHCFSLSGTIRALKASTLWIPVTGGTRVDIKAIKNAMNSAVDAMQAMGSAICYLSSKVDQVSSLISDLLASTRKEIPMLEDCAELLAFAGELQVQDSSLRGHIMQLGQVLCK